MNKNIIRLSGLLFIGLIFLQGCMADLRTNLVKNEGSKIENQQKGKAILDRAVKSQGFDKINNHKVYSFNGMDNWKGLMGGIGKVWPEKKSKLHFKYQAGSFDGQVKLLDGKDMGKVAGLQNWNYYEVSNGTDTLFQKTNKRISFGIAAFQYFTEMVSRLSKAPIITYAGEDEIRGAKYDLIFCTWDDYEPHKGADQYIAWVNKKTGLMDFAQYTIRDNYLKPPGYSAMYGGVEFSNFKNIDGVKIAHEHTVYVFKLKEKQKKHLHVLKISDFEFDNFDVEELRLDKEILEGGDFKVKS